MFINENVIAVIFRFINFISIIALSLFLFKKHILPSIFERIAKEKECHDSLLIQQSNLEKKQVTLDILLKEDAAKCEQFRAKIDTWKKIVLQEFAQLQQERNDYIDILINKKNQNAVQMEQARTQAIVLAKALPQLENSLVRHFTSEHHTIEYLNSIVHFMDEKNNEQ